MLTSLKSWHSLTKINISLQFCVKKNVTATVNLFVNFRTKAGITMGLDYMIKKWRIWFDWAKIRKWQTANCKSWRQHWRRHQSGTKSGEQTVIVWAHMFMWMVDILNTNFEPRTFLCILFILSILVLVVSINLNDINMCMVLNVLLLCRRLLHSTVATK